MQHYIVHLTTMAYMKGHLEVQAASPTAAQQMALHQAGDVAWEYDGVADGLDQGPEVSDVEEVP